MVAALNPVVFDDLPGWYLDNPVEILAGLQDCARHVKSTKPYSTGSFGLRWSDFKPALDDLATVRPNNAADARAFFESHFQPVVVTPDGDTSGFVTGFYEPEIDVSPVQTGAFQYPFYARPGDLVKIDPADRPASMDPAFAFGRRTGNAIVEFADRRLIDQGALSGKGLEIAWAASKVDVFFAHIQGSARLHYADGTVHRITYAAKTGHPFTAIGRILIDLGEQQSGQVTMQSLRRWLHDNPQRVDEILWHNRSYIFFRRADVEDLDRGPVAAAKVPLIAGRSLAVDRLIHTFATPIYVQADSLTHLGNGPFRRLMLAQDTGSAIVGPARGDIFTGSGQEAGNLAGAIKHQARFFLLVPKAAAQRLHS
tara:strand:+ start:93814 stop:94917 length:1104 start_codon:yes stop_codon:yes gene_type:complete